MKSDVCTKCGIPRYFYDLKIEPGFFNPDYALKFDCIFGHTWKQETIDIAIKALPELIRGVE